MKRHGSEERCQRTGVFKVGVIEVIVMDGKAQRQISRAVAPRQAADEVKATSPTMEKRIKEFQGSRRPETVLRRGLDTAPDCHETVPL